MKNFEGLRGGDTIKFRIPDGMSLKHGKRVQDWKVVTAKVNPYLIFKDHVVANHGSCGRVVDASNFISQVIV